MTGTICPVSELQSSDPRLTYHVKGLFIENLFTRFGATAVDELEIVLQTEDKFKYGHWSCWSKCLAKVHGEPLCGEGKNIRKRVTGSGKRDHEMESRPCSFKNLDGTPTPCTAKTKPIPQIPHGWMSWSDWSPCTKTCFDRYRTENTRSANSRPTMWHMQLSGFNQFLYFANKLDPNVK